MGTGERDTNSLVVTMETLVASTPMENNKAASDKAGNIAITNNKKRPAPLTGGCKIEGFVRVKKIEHYLQVGKTEVVSSELSLLENHFQEHSSLVESIYIPVMKFHFEPSPMQVLIMENRKSFSHFIANVCAIIGDVFTVGSQYARLSYAQQNQTGEESGVRKSVLNLHREI